MAKFQFRGIDNYAKKLYKLSNKSEGMIKRAVWEGAHIIADAVVDEIKALPEVNANPKPGEELTGVFSYEKQGLLEGMGLPEMQNDNGFINTKIGFEGYNRLKSKSYPNGHPNALIARSINSGSSYRRRHPFMMRAIAKAKEKAKAAMKQSLEKDIENVMKE